MGIMRLRQFTTILSAAIWLAGCSINDASFQAPTGLPPQAVTTSEVTAVSLIAPGSQDKDLKDIYATLYPYYAELCALSEIKKKPGFGADINGGFGGHSVLYLNGVCRDHGIDYPVIELCDEEGSAKPDRANQGVGLSVNDHFKNANWVATEGKDFLFYGSLKPGDELNKDGYRRTQAAAMKMGILNGIQFHERFFDKIPAGMSQRDYMYEISIATDYAVDFGRDRYCARVPMNRDQMKRVVTYLNDLNAPYRAGKREFQWDVLGNNCSHMTHNALAAAGIWTEVGVDEPFFIAAFDFPVPKNEFVNLIRRTNDMPIDNLLTLYGDDVARQNLLIHGRLPLRPGALAEAAPIMQKNDLYDTDTRLIFYDPIGEYQRAFERILADPRYLDLRANLVYFSTVYQRIKTERKPLGWYFQADRKIPGPDADSFPAFYKRFYTYIDHESAGVDAKLAALDGIKDHDQPVMSSSADTVSSLQTP